MMKIYPESASVQLEFDRVKSLLVAHCQCEYAKTKAEQLRIHTQKHFVETELKQSFEYLQLLRNGVYFPNDYILNLSKELKLIKIPGAVLTGEQLTFFRKLAISMERIYRWFDAEKKRSLLWIICNC